MTDYSEDLSTVLDVENGPSAAGGGSPVLSDDTDKTSEPLSLRGDLEAVFKEAKDAEPEKADGSEEPEKPVKPEDEKQPDKAEAEKPKDEDEAKPAEPAKERPAPEKEAKPETETPQHREAPRNFLPDSKEQWRNVPRSVKRDIAVMEQAIATEREQAREVSQRYESVREFDELARQNGQDLRQSLSRVVEFENQMRANPIRALQMALIEAGPRKADGTPLSLMEVAQYIVQGGAEQYQQLMAETRRQEPQEDPRLNALQQEVMQMRGQQLLSSVIEPFKASHPRYSELEDDIAFFLTSGRISPNLSVQDRLEAAYDMAVRLNPSSTSPRNQADQESPDRVSRRADDDFGGNKSIKSSPGSVTETVEDEAGGGESIRDSIMKAGRRLSKV